MFNDHVSACCLTAVQQINALAKISKYFDLKSKSVIHHDFIRSNFEYCPLVWHFCGKINNDKLEKIKKRSLRILHDTYELSYDDSLSKNGSNTQPFHRLKLVIMETYKTFHYTNAYMAFSNSTARLMNIRSSKLIQLKRRTTFNGLRPFSFPWSQLWNDIVNSDPAMANCDFSEVID